MWINSFFDPNAPGTFVAYSRPHFAMIELLLMTAAGIYFGRSRIRRDPVMRMRLEYGLLFFLTVPEGILYIWYTAENEWDLRGTLPLELCSISQILAILMLLTRSRLLYQLVFFAGIGGALQAVLTPDLAYTFPHFRYFHFFLVHIAIILSALYMTWVEEYAPTWKSIGITMVFLNLLVVAVGGIDYWLDTNYMYLRNKPENPSLLDLLGPYPYYLLSEEVIAMLVFTVMYLPFLLKRGVKIPAR